jgi:Domain of unknown function (DUF4880)
MSSHNSSHDEKKTIKETLLDQAAAWEGKLDSGEMSENERLDLNAWLNEPRNARALSEVRTLTALIEELPEKKAQTLRRIPLKTTFFGGGIVSVSSTTVLLPGQTLARAAKSLLTPNAYKRYVAPVIADMQQEYAVAVAAGRKSQAWYIALYGHLRVIPNWLFALVAGRLDALLRRGR